MGSTVLSLVQREVNDQPGNLMVQHSVYQKSCRPKGGYVQIVCIRASRRDLLRGRSRPVESIPILRHPGKLRRCGLFRAAWLQSENALAGESLTNQSAGRLVFASCLFAFLVPVVFVLLSAPARTRFRAARSWWYRSSKPSASTCNRPLSIGSMPGSWASRPAWRFHR